MNDYGDRVADQMTAEFEPLVTAAMTGDKQALHALIAFAAQKGYTQGFGAAVTT